MTVDFGEGMVMGVMGIMGVMGVMGKGLFRGVGSNGV